MFRVFVAFWIVFGAIIFGTKYWQGWVTQQVADMPQQTDLLPPPTMVIPTIDPGQLSRSLNTPGFYPGMRR
jgi:hypothetical protein